MKNDKFCINRTLGYLVLLVLVVVGFFYVMGKANTTNTASNAKAAAKGKDCMYGGKVLTLSSTPYKYQDTATTCIVDKDNNNIGYRCKTDMDSNSATYGQIVASGSVKDLTSCPVPAAASRTECMYGNKKLSAYSPAYTLDANNCILTGAGGWTGYYCDPTTFKNTYNLAKCKKPATRTACQYNGAAATVDANDCILTSAGAWTGYYCDPSTFLNTYSLNKCPKPTGAPRTACQYNGAAAVLDGDNCVLTAAGGTRTGYYCNTPSYMTSYNLTKCPKTVARTECMYGNKKLSAYSPAYTLDANRCILTGTGGWTGYYCNPTTFTNKYDLKTCPPTPSVRTECWYGGQPLSASNGRYTMEAGTGCILDTNNGGFNNGYWCDVSTYTTKYNTATCPL